MTLREWEKRDRKIRKTAALLSIFIPGLGQLLRKRWSSGFFFIILLTLSVLFLKAIWKGYNPGFIAIILSFLFLWLLNILDAYKGPFYPKSPCRRSCPAGIDAVGYINLISQRRFDDALYLISKKAPLLGILGYICNASCEDKCSRGGYDEAIAIRHLKAAASRYGRLEFERKESANKRVAIIGGGPCGLTCACFLLQMGYKVSLYESLSYLGGMLRIIPQYRLPRDILDMEIERIISQGLDYCLSTSVGRDISFEEIRKDYDALFIAVGDSLPLRLKIKGEELEGVIYGIELLKKINNGERVNLRGKVAVIGGGNVAIDCARSALRLGAKEICIVCLEKRDLSSKNRMPAFDDEIRGAEEEGIIVHPSLGPKRIIGKRGKVSGLKTIRCVSVYEKNGEFDPKFDEGSGALFIKADTVIVAIGQIPDFPFLSKGVKLKKGYKTSLKGVFASGSTSTVVEAVAKGRGAALQIDRYIRGNGRYIIDKLLSYDYPIKLIKINKHLEKKARIRIDRLSLERRRKNFEIIEKIGSEEAVREEAERCLNCPYRFL
jgi:NADPH-dependent glutamate synthase beta subunit-like oxidoreductase